MKSRVYFWDITRAMAAFLVVLGHVISDNGVLGFAVYIFHVPTLFMVSGLVYRQGKEGFWPFVWKKFRRILIPYFLFGLVSIGIYAILGPLAADGLGLREGEYGIGSNLYGLLYGNCKNGLMKFNLPMWFLPVLFLMEIFQYGTEKLYAWLFPTGRYRSLFLLGMMALSVALAQLNGRVLQLSMLPFNLENAETLYFFFLMGNLLRNPSMEWNRRLEEGKGKRWLFLAGGLAALTLCMYVGYQNSVILYTADDYGKPLYFYKAAVCGALAVLLFSAAIHRCRPIEYLGERTMTVLCLHKFPIVLFQLLLPVVTDNDIPAVFFSVVVCGMCLVADWIIRKWFPFFLGDWYTKDKSR